MGNLKPGCCFGTQFEIMWRRWPRIVNLQVFCETVPHEVVLCIPVLPTSIFSVRTSALYLQLTHMMLCQVLNCQSVGQPQICSKVRNKCSISISIYCHPKHSHANVYLSPCPPFHLHTAGKGKTHFEFPTSSQLSEWRCWLPARTSQFHRRVKWHCAGCQASFLGRTMQHWTLLGRWVHPQMKGCWWANVTEQLP